MFSLELFGAVPRDGLRPIPGTRPLTIEAALCPPMMYYLALLFIPPAPPDAVDATAVKLLRNLLALVAGFLFIRLPLAYHVPQSIGLTYQLGLVGLYGCARVVDAFFLSPYLFHHIPRRVRYSHVPRLETPVSAPRPTSRPEEDADDKTGDYFVPKSASTSIAKHVGDVQAKTPSRRRSSSAFVENVRRGSMPSLDDSFAMLGRTLSGPQAVAVVEHASTEDGWPHTFLDRASWAMELELSMRGVGFTWTTADVRHTRKTWLPTVANRLHSIAVHAVPILATSFAVIRSIHVSRLADADAGSWSSPPPVADTPFDALLPLPLQLLLTAALGAFLMAAFSLAHSAAAIVCAPLAPSPLAFFPPLYTTRIWSITSVRGFWSHGWHRLFARFFLVYGVWPGEWLERRLMRRTAAQRADVGKVLGGFLSSAFCHSFAVRGVLGGEWGRATGEARFFAVNGVAVVLEEAVKKAVEGWRRGRGAPEHVWYDAWVGRAWWTSVLLFSGRNFARGWVDAGLVREMAGY